MYTKLKALITICFLTSTSLLYAQYGYGPVEERACATIGILKGGGGLVGADFEFLLTDRLGLQLGVGLISYGAGLNYHFKPSIRSSFLSLQYSNQGTGDAFIQNIVGPNYVYRGNKWFTAQIGLGRIIETGPIFPKDIDVPPLILTYAIGVYLPF